MKAKTAGSKRFVCLVTVLLAILHYACVAAPSILDTAVNPANGHTYHLLDNSNWTTAENQAVLLGGHLVTINDSAENSWVWDRWATGRSLWIGFTDAAMEGTFRWVSGEPVTFTSWRAGEPNDGNGVGEDYTYMYSTGFGLDRRWNDYQNNSTVGPEPLLYGVVEIVPEPSPRLLLTCGSLVGLLAWANRSRWCRLKFGRSKSSF